MPNLPGNTLSPDFIPAGTIQLASTAAALDLGGIHDWLLSHLLGGVTLIVLLGALTEFLVRSIQRRRLGTPTRHQLDLEDNQPPKVGYAILWLLGELAATAIWCLYEGRRATSDMLFRFETFSTWWGYVATPRDRAVVVAFVVLLIVVGGFFGWIMHRIVWRTCFPNLARLDPHASKGGLAEPIGRLFIIRKYYDPALDTDEGRAARQRQLDGFEAEKRSATEALASRYAPKAPPRRKVRKIEARRPPAPTPNAIRLYYKHGFRIFPPLAFDKLDLALTQYPEPFGLGTVAVRCARIERDMARGRRYRKVSTSPYGAAPLGDTFREDQEKETRNRKVSIVLTGAVMNTETTRKKWEREATITRMEARGLDALRKSRKPASAPSPVPPSGVAPEPAQPSDGGSHA